MASRTLEARLGQLSVSDENEPSNGVGSGKAKVGSHRWSFYSCMAEHLQTGIDISRDIDHTPGVKHRAAKRIYESD